ncbi:hypothetical protein HAX54_008710 [Datura stramonium]|uniref:Uncharacterized protein n=1 Tax=Datura stramonium TaxID=4076 RepID=A0ABS8RVK9_DATST|nr:hypothetical protein [Datura stramonium]
MAPTTNSGVEPSTQDESTQSEHLDTSRTLNEQDSSFNTPSSISVTLSDTTLPSTHGEPLSALGTSSFTPPSFETLSSTPVPPSIEIPTTNIPRVNPNTGLGTDDISVLDFSKGKAKEGTSECNGLSGYNGR